ncbi:MAG: low specificity L-threonine aldolase [Alphaproteobacteria bacterium]
MSSQPQPFERRQFASDNISGIAPEAWEELQRANAGHAASYGDDEWTASVANTVRDLFETDCDVYFVFNGTAANSLALATLCQSYNSVICHSHSHIETDECGAPQFFSNGSKFLTYSGADGKLTPEAVDRLANQRTDVHHPKSKALAITQATEYGTAYSVDEVAALCAVAQKNGLKTHMDGARFANAVARLDAAPADLTWRAGIDVLSFGGTKLGMPVGDMVVFFNRDLSDEFAFRCKQAGQLASKMRYLAAPWVGMLRDGAWLNHATHANDMADYLAARLAEKGVKALYPVQANAVFADFSAAQCKTLWGKGWKFYNFLAEGGARLMCSWDITKDDIDALIADLD